MPALRVDLDPHAAQGEGGRMNIPVSTFEKPLTVIDFIAHLEQYGSFRELTAYANAIPPEIVQDDRFAKAFKKRLDAIRGRR